MEQLDAEQTALKRSTVCSVSCIWADEQMNVCIPSNFELNDT